jgi:hypothetical protein
VQHEVYYWSLNELLEVFVYLIYLSIYQFSSGSPVAGSQSLFAILAGLVRR